MMWLTLFALEWAGLCLILWRQHHRAQVMRRWGIVTTRVVAEVLQGLRSGHDLMSALCRLSQSPHGEVSQLGLRWQRRVSSGLSLVDGQEQGGTGNALLQRVVNHLISFLQTGANPVPWLERTEHFLAQKQHYQRRLRTKTTQLRLQVYMLLGFSWLSFMTTLWIFPGSFAALLKHDLALRCLVMGLGIQILSIIILDRVLSKGVCETL